MDEKLEAGQARKDAWTRSWPSWRSGRLEQVRSPRRQRRRSRRRRWPRKRRNRLSWRCPPTSAHATAESWQPRWLASVPRQRKLASRSTSRSRWSSPSSTPTLPFGGYGQSEFTPAYTADDCANVLKRYWGSDFDAKMAVVRKTVKAAGPAFSQWLDDTLIGNHPAALIALSSATRRCCPRIRPRSS